jgi:hypothetical protein
MKEEKDNPQENQQLSEEPSVSREKKRAIEKVWRVIAILIWSIVLAPLMIKVEEDAGLDSLSMPMIIILLFVMGVGFSFLSKITFSESRYTLLLNFGLAFFFVIIWIIARATMIAKCGI